MSSYKDPEFKEWWERSKDQINFIQEYNNGELSKSMRDAYTAFLTDKNRPPTRQQVLAMAAEKQAKAKYLNEQACRQVKSSQGLLFSEAK